MRLRDGENWVPNGPIRTAVVEAVARGEHTYSGLARALGWTGRGDVSRLKRRLGLAPDTNPRRRSRTMRRDIAVAVVNALGRDPVDFQL